MDEKMSASRIVVRYTEDRMSSRPEFYSGRGAILGDLDSKLLEMIYQGILKEIGKTAAQQFVEMVEDVDVLSATLFLNSLYALEANGWVWKKPKRESKAMDHIDAGPDNDGRMAVGFASMASWMFGGSDRDETFMIRSEFLTKHGRKLKAPRWYGRTNWA